MCPKHYQRWRTKGDANLVTYERIAGGDAERFWRAVETDGPVPAHSPSLGPCWEWTRARHSRGYGMFSVGGRMVLAHRYSYEAEHGVAPPLLDHRCQNTACVRPSHLRPATQLENNRHRSGAMTTSRTGVRGVTRARSGRYLARVKHGGVTEYLGTFDTVEEASAAASSRRRELWGDFAGR